MPPVDGTHKTKKQVEKALADHFGLNEQDLKITKNIIMNGIVKIILISVNLLILFIAVLWINNEQSHEPYIIAIGQVGSLLVIFFEQKISKIFVDKVSDSEVNISTPMSDHTNIKVSRIQDKSEVRIKRK